MRSEKELSIKREPLRGQVAVVTGASSGIGAAVARSLAREDAHVALAARRLDELLRVQAGLTASCKKIAPADIMGA